MLKRSVTQNDTWTWASASSVESDILRDGYITHIDFTCRITPSATLAAANQPDGVYRVIDNFSIRGGSQTYFTLPAEQGGRVWHYMMQARMRYAGHGAGLTIVAPSQLYSPVLFRFHPGSRPHLPNGQVNYFDLSSFLPAIEESSLRGTWLTTVNSVLDDIVTLSSAVLTATIYQVQGDPSEIKAEMAAQGVTALVTPAPTAEVVATTAAASDYSWQRDLPTGGYLRGIAILGQDATATRPLRAPDELTELAILMPGIGARLVEVDTEALWAVAPAASFQVADDAVMLGGMGAANGVFYLPLNDRGQTPQSRDYGLNLIGARTGEWKLGATINTYASGDDVLIFYDRLIPYVGRALA